MKHKKKNQCKAIVLIAHILQILVQEAMTDLKAVIETIITTAMADITVTTEKADIKDAKEVTKEIIAKSDTIEAAINNADHNKAVLETITQVLDRDNDVQCSVNLKKLLDRYLLARNN